MLRVRSAEKGRQAITHYRVLRRRREGCLLELRLGTGRRHQIRVQLAEAGWPIVGDVAHGGARGSVGPAVPARDAARLRAPGDRAAGRLRERAARRLGIIRAVAEISPDHHPSPCPLP